MYASSKFFKMAKASKSLRLLYSVVFVTLHILLETRVTGSQNNLDGIVKKYLKPRNFS